MIIQEFEDRLQTFSKTVDQEEARRDLIRDNLRKQEASLKAIETKEKLLNGVVILLQKAADYSRTQAKRQIEDIVTQSIAYIMQNSSKFTVDLLESPAVPIPN